MILYRFEDVVWYGLGNLIEIYQILNIVTEILHVI